MAESDTPLVPPEFWPRVMELCLLLQKLPPAEQEMVLAVERTPEVVYWVREILTAEKRPFEPPDFGIELARLRVGGTVADRYRLDEHIGSGGYGHVYRAHDLVTGDCVAVKLLARSLDDASEPHEWSTLRVLDLPGFVSLLDARELGSELALIMPLIAGSPFPGTGARSWDVLEDRVIALLEAIERLHAAGFVHGDLKPSNVLVDEHGFTTILDLGIARRWGSAGRREGVTIGTPGYAAPELFTGAGPSPASDLYAVGLMVYEAVAGVTPDPDPLRTLVPLRKLVPDLPPGVASFIDALLRRDGRPSTAGEALALLGRGSLEERLRSHIGRLGAEAELGELLCALRSGRPLDLVGEPESGKSALLEELARRLEDAGESVILLPGSTQGILEVLCSREEVRALGSWRRVRPLVLSRLADEEPLILWDDVDRVEDPLLLGALEQRRSRGRIATTRTGGTGPASALTPLSDEQLRALFEGPDAILHLREDAAERLRERTGGRRGCVVAELAAWVRAGFARMGESGCMQVRREGLDRLAAMGPGPLRSLGGMRELTTEELRVVALVQLAGAQATRAFLGHADPNTAMFLDERIDSLVRNGVITESGGALSSTRRVPLSQVLSQCEQARLHDLIAERSRADDPHRLQHRTRAGVQASSDALDLGRAALAAGRPERALPVLLEGLRQGGGSHERELLEDLVEAALTLQTRSAMQRALHELAHASVPVADLTNIATIGLRLQERDHSTVVAALMAAPKLSPRWQRWRAVLMAQAGRFQSDLHQEAVGILSDLSESGDEAAQRDLAVALGAHAYTRDPEEAVFFHRRAITLSPDPLRRCASLLSLSSAALECGAWDEVAACLSEARILARTHRYSLQEARCTLIESSLAYRRGTPSPIDPEVFRAVELMGQRSLLAHLHLNEAARHYRAGSGGDAIRHCRAAVASWREENASPGAIVARALGVACGAAVPEDDHARLLAQARDCPLPGAAVQAVALLSPAPDAAWLARFAQCVRARIPARLQPLRREVLSVREALSRLEREVRDAV